MITLKRSYKTDESFPDRYHGLFYVSPNNRLSIFEITGWLEENCEGVWEQNTDDKLLLVTFESETDFQATKSYFKAEHSVPSFGFSKDSFFATGARSTDGR